MSSNNSAVAVGTTPAVFPTTLQPLGEYIWNYIARDLGLTACWLVTILLLSCILLCYRHRPDTLTVAKGGLSTTILIVFVQHLVNTVSGKEAQLPILSTPFQIVFLISQYGVNFAGNYNGPVINGSNWLNTWWSFWVGNYITVAPAAVFFVTLDRLLALKLAYRYGPEPQSVLAKVEGVVLLLLYCLAFLSVMIAWPYHDRKNIEWGRWCVLNNDIPTQSATSPAPRTTPSPTGPVSRR